MSLATPAISSRTRKRSMEEVHSKLINSLRRSATCLIIMIPNRFVQCAPCAEAPALNWFLLFSLAKAINLCRICSVDFYCSTLRRCLSVCGLIGITSISDLTLCDCRVNWNANELNLGGSGSMYGFTCRFFSPPRVFIVYALIVFFSRFGIHYVLRAVLRVNFQNETKAICEMTAAKRLCVQQLASSISQTTSANIPTNMGFVFSVIVAAVHRLLFLFSCKYFVALARAKNRVVK